MNDIMILLPIAVPALAGLITILVPGRKAKWVSAAVAIIASTIQLAIAISLFPTDSSLWPGWAMGSTSASG